MASFVIGLFFLRFWKNTGDRFFLFFATAFGLEGVSRALLGVFQGSGENEPLYYLIRLLSFTLILIAIISKNRGQRTGGRADSGVK